MPLQNRVTPFGDLIAHPARGLVYGNRGCLHDDAGRIRRRHATKRWIACRLSFRGRRRSPLVQPGKYTGLFFLDEATAFAAGHRPCAECRRDDYNRFVGLIDIARADAIDARLHDERLGARRRSRAEDLPDGAFVVRDGEAWLVLGDELLRWTSAGYTDRVARDRSRVEILTPPSLVAVLRAGWRGDVPFVHPSTERT
jgi:hypothetical protein